MAKKFEIIGQALVITDDSIPRVIYDNTKGEVYYDNKTLVEDGIIKINNIDALDNAIKTAPKVLLSEAVNSLNEPFTVQTFQTFARENLGFKTASGGSGAGEDGDSAFEIAVSNGFTGTQTEWLDSLRGADGADGGNLILTVSTIVSSRDILATDVNGINNSTASTDVTITLINDATISLEVGSILMFKRSGTGNVILTAGTGVTAPTHQTYTLNDTLVYRKTAVNTWECLNPPKDLSNVGSGEVNTINSTITGEPTGSTVVTNIVSLTEAEHISGIKNNSTLYIRTTGSKGIYLGSTHIASIDGVEDTSLTYGTELLPDSSSLSTNNTTNVTYSGGIWSFNNAPRYDYIRDLGLLEVGKNYKIDFTVSNYVEGALRVARPDSGTTGNISANGNYSFTFNNAANAGFEIASNITGNNTFDISNISIKEIL